MKFPIWFSAGLIAVSVTTATATPQDASHELSPAEEFVVAQVTAGEAANLDTALNADHTKKFPEEKDRKLTAHFLEDLLTGTLRGVKLHRHGVGIYWAIVDEEIDLKNAQIPCEVLLNHCQFMRPVTFDRASFAGTVSFDNSAFKADASFNAMKVGGDARFNLSVFEGPAEFIGADTGGSFSAQSAKFQNTEKGALFSGMKVRGEARFNSAVFQGPVYFIGADIAGGFEAQAAKFQSKEKQAMFVGMKVGGDAYFTGAVFEGMVVFSYANIAGKFEAQSAKLQNEEPGAFFWGMKVRGEARFNFAVFRGTVRFTRADIAGNFEANGVQFQNKQNSADFYSMKVGHDALFKKAVFDGPVSFGAADIANNFEAIDAQFNNKEKDANFSGMKVGGDAIFYSAVFEGPVRFNYADFARLSLSSPFSPKVARQFHMQGMRYKYIRAVPQPEPSPRSARLPQPKPFPRSTIIPWRAYPLYPASPGLHVIPLRLSPLHREPEAFIRAVLQPESSPGSHMIPLRLSPTHRRTAALINAVSRPELESESREALLQLANQSAYSADVYSSLEEFFLRQGDRGDADKAFIAGKSRERNEYRRSDHWFGWLASWILYLLVGYGRRPWQAGIPCAVLVALGCVLFSPKKMEPQRPEDTPRVYSRFWYSLGLFLPFVDLQADKVWKPKADQTFLRNYMRVHVLLGWILIPIVLAALTGLIK